MTRPSKAAALLGSLFIAFVLVAGSLVSIDAVTRSPTLYEEDVQRAVDGLGEPRPGVLRVVVMGDSLGRNAFGDGSELEAVLAERGVAAQVANLAGGGVDLEVAAPAFDEIIAAAPDVIVLLPEVVLDLDYAGPPDLRLRLRWLVTNQYKPSYFDVFCPADAHTDEVLARSIAATRERLRDPVLRFADADRLIEAAAGAGAEVLVVRLPRSAPLADAVGAQADEFRQAIVDRLAGFPNVAVAPDVELPGLDNYCDYSHLSPSGRAAFLDVWAQAFADFVAGSS